MARLFGEKGEHTPGNLNAIDNCWLMVPAGNTGTTSDRFSLREIPTITDSKGANYTSQAIFGRSSPIRSYSDSSARTINVSFRIYNTTDDIRQANLSLIRRIAAAVHPGYDPTYAPPPVCQFQCGLALSGDITGNKPNPINCLITNYSFNYGQDYYYDNEIVPFVIEISLDLEVVYSQGSLPGRADVISGNF